MKRRILFLTPYPHSTAASQRFRFEQYYDFLKESGFEIRIESFLDRYTWDILYKPGHHLDKIKGILYGFSNRIKVLKSLAQFDFVFIHREAAPIGPPILEWLILKIFKKKVIFDFDDAIWLNNTSTQNRLVTSLRFNRKINFVLKHAYKVSAANEILRVYVSNYNANVILNPTTLDTERNHNQIKKHVFTKPTIGWTGTHSTLKYIDIVIPVFKKLRLKYQFDILIISNEDPHLQSIDYKFIQWNADTEIEDLLRLDIGIMPLYDDEWSRGKSGFKALQYMALGIPAVISNVGVNEDLVRNESTGYLCNTEEDWEVALKTLITSHELREKQGANGRIFVEGNFSVKSNAQNFLSLFK